MKSALWYMLIVALVLTLIVVAGLVLAGIFGQFLNVLYIALIVLAGFSLIATALFMYAMFKLLQMILLIREEIRPLLHAMQETIGVAKDTAEVVKETAQHAGQAAGTLASATRLTKEYAVSPPIQAAALLLASRQMVKVFFGRGHVRTRTEERKQRQLAMLQQEYAETAEGGEKP